MDGELSAGKTHRMDSMDRCACVLSEEYSMHSGRKSDGKQDKKSRTENQSNQSKNRAK